jgi:type I restriction enzyme, S subunit
MELKPGYKQTEVRVIPEDWNLLPLGWIGKWFSGGTPSMSVEAYWLGNIPWVSPKDMKVPRLYDSIDHITTKAVASGARLLPAGTILIVTRGMILAHSVPVARAEVALAFNQDIKAVVTADDIDDEFILYWLTANAQRLRGLTTESTHGTKRLPTEMLLRELVACPPLPEQRAIAEALSDADALIESLEQLIAKRRAVKQGAMQELLSGRRRLLGFSREWEVRTLAELEQNRAIKLFRGKVISQKDIDNNPGSYPIYSSSVHAGGLFGHYGTYMLNEELITWSIDGGGHFFYRPKHRYSVTNVCGYMRVLDAKLSCRFLAYALQELHSHKIFDYTMKAHPSVIRGEYTVPLPSTTEQTAIAAVLSDMDAEIAALEAKLAKARQVKQGMMQELLTGKTRLI